MQSGLLQFLVFFCGGVASLPAATIFKAQGALTQPINAHPVSSHVNSYRAAVLPQWTISSPVEHESPLSQSTGASYRKSKRYLDASPVSTPSHPRGVCLPKKLRSIFKSFQRSSWGLDTSAFQDAVGSHLVPVVAIALASPAPTFYRASLLTSLIDAIFGFVPATVNAGTGTIGVGIGGDFGARCCFLVDMESARVGANVFRGEGAGIGLNVGAKDARTNGGIIRRASKDVIGNFLANLPGEHQTATTLLGHARSIIPAKPTAGVGASTDTIPAVLDVEKILN